MSSMDMVKMPEAVLLLWSEIAVDMIGPWTLEVGNRTEKSRALTIIDLFTISLRLSVSIIRQQPQ
jgi:hypothetical protein